MEALRSFAASWRPNPSFSWASAARASAADVPASASGGPAAALGALGAGATVLAGLLVPWMPAHRSAQVADAVADLNRTCPQIRVGLEDAMGFGHQSASMHVACRLRALGYHGVFQIVAAEHTLPKLRALLPSLDSEGCDAPTPIVLTPNEAARCPRTVGVTGGWGSTPMTLVQYCLMLQPLQWVGQHGIVGPSGLRPLRLSPYAAYRYDATASTPLETSIRGTMSQASGASVLQLVRHVRNQQVDLMMVYGMHHLGRSQETVRKLVDALQGGERKTVCFVVDGYRSYADAYKLDDALSVAKALSARGPHVVTLACKKLPKPVFRGLYELSTLPPILEGANTTNLMRLLGRPYLSVYTRHTPYPQLWGHKQVPVLCEDLANLLNGRMAFDKAVLCEFLRQSNVQRSLVRRYFTALQEHVRAPLADQVAEGLIALHVALQHEIAVCHARVLSVHDGR